VDVVADLLIGEDARKADVDFILIIIRVVGEEGSFAYLGFKGVMMAMYGKISIVTE